MELEAQIDDYLIKKVDKDRDLTKFHISELGKGKQSIMERFKEKGKKDKPKPQLKRIFENGDFVHYRYYKYFLEMGILRAIEIKAIDDDVFSGTADAIISDKDGTPWVIDIKSCNSWVFKKLTDMKSEHKIQILCYMYFLKLDNGMLLYENKDDQSIKIFKIQMTNENKEMIENLIKEFRELKSQIDNGIIIVEEEEYKELTIENSEMIRYEV